MSEPKKKINRAVTVAAIKKAAEGHITDVEKFNKLMEDDEELEDAAMMWDVEITYL